LPTPGLDDANTENFDVKQREEIPTETINNDSVLFLLQIDARSGLLTTGVIQFSNEF